MKSNLENWIKEQQDVLDELIATTATSYFNQNKEGSENFIFDAQEASEELYYLMKGKDLCYDRPSIGFVYSTWYHAKRINTFLKYFINILTACEDSHVEIFDLGAGTGAVQWALGIIYAGMKNLGMTIPKFKIINIDTSPFMLKYHSLLWNDFLEKYPKCSDISWEYQINSWTSTDDSRFTNPWIFASYLFDSNENRDSISKDFSELIRRYQPKVILLLTSNQQIKREHLESVSEEVKKQGYKCEEVNSSADIFEGDLVEVSLFREENSHLISGFRGKSCTWKDQSFIGKIFKLAKSEQLSLSLTPKLKIKSIDLFKEPIKIRRDVKLNDVQLKAAKHSNDPVIITGTAGSGKSIVITERIKNLVEQRNYDPSLRILLTTFNKELIFQLGCWLEEILDPQKSERVISTWQGEEESISHFYFTKLSERTPNITIMHFDVLPTRIGNIRGSVNPSKDWHNQFLEQIIAEVSTQNTLKGNEFNDVLNPEFLQEEFYRVYYGLQYDNEIRYLNGERTGRGKSIRLLKNSERRKLVWQCLVRYHNHLISKNIHSFTSKRIKFLEILNRQNSMEKFSHIFVDEFQDCTKADFEIFYKLLQNPNHLVIAGDLAQSVRLGRSYHIPREADMKRRRPSIVLDGSYRLPYRITECLKNLSQQIVKKHNNNAHELKAFKGSPAGARPIVVYAQKISDISQKIKDIFETYSSSYNLHEITILETDNELCYSLRKIGVPTTTDSVLRIKGLEKECVLWSVRQNIEDDNEAAETVYTILTRTSCILIIALSGSISDTYKEIIGTFDVERLLFWDQESKNRYSEFCKTPLPVSDDVIDDD